MGIERSQPGCHVLPVMVPEAVRLSRELIALAEAVKAWPN
jgi:hypothetical protein